ncbi:uncharacterized protein [Haliotis asinina]|uniref:uncharacterized protein n=1 Tax=Haliotis asinina TaxID=109174 RepID=UPI00353181E6
MVSYNVVDLFTNIPFDEVSVPNLTLVSNSPNNITYRKSIHTHQYIHYLSNHHPQIKRAIASTPTRRAKSVCDSDHLQTEIDHLRTTFINLNGYPKQLVDRNISSSLQQQEECQPKPGPSPVRINIPYQGQISHHICRLLKKTAGIDVTFRSDKTLRTILKASDRCSPTKTTHKPRSYIYKPMCDCGASYVGETSRPIDTRLKEHRTSVEKSDLNNPSHSTDWQATPIIASNIHDWLRRKISEAINIKRLAPQRNRDQGFYLPNAREVN